MQNDILFDNIYIGHSVEDANAFRKETFDLKVEAEKAEEKANEPKWDEKKDEVEPVDFKKDPVKFVLQKVQPYRQQVEDFIAEAKKDPIKAAQATPQVAGGLALAALAIVAFILTALSPAAPTKEQIKAATDKTKTAAEKAKDRASEAIATGTEQSKEATKRATRSTAH
jgi:calnexin